MANLKEFENKGVDWRGQIRRNQRRTIFVIFLFVMIYFAIGSLIDLYLLAPPETPTGTTGPEGPYYVPQAPAEPLSQTFMKLVTLKVFPIATSIMLGVAFLSLIITFLFHRQIMMLGTDYTEITPDTKDFTSKQLYNVVDELKIASGMRFMPKVYIIEEDYMNAFASGMSEKTAMVAITRGLLNKLNRAELQAVMAHEVSHIRHEDIKLTMTVAILSNIMLIAIDIIFRGVIYSRDRDNRLAFIIILLRFILPIITLLLVLYLSRTRELMADTGSVELLRDNEALASALIKIDSDYKDHEDKYSKEFAETEHEGIRQSSYFYDPAYAGIDMVKSINNLFSTHPSLQVRLEALGFKVRK